jgi:hypothetical protein
MVMTSPELTRAAGKKLCDCYDGSKQAKRALSRCCGFQKVDQLRKRLALIDLQRFSFNRRKSISDKQLPYSLPDYFP